MTHFKIYSPIYNDVIAQGNRLMKSGSYRQACECYRSALVAFPSDTSLTINLGIACQRLGRLNEAAALYRRAIAMDPTASDAYNNQGNLYVDENRPDDAIAFYRRAIAEEPGYAGAYINLGNTLMQVSRLVEAKESYLEGLKLRPSDPVVLGRLGNVAAASGDEGEALSYFSRAIELHPQLGSAWIGLGDLFSTSGDPERARHHYMRAGEAATGRMLKSLFDQRDPVPMIDYLTVMERANPNNLIVAAVSQYLCHQWDLANPYRFITNAIDLIDITNLASGSYVIYDLAAEIVDDANLMGFVADPQNKSTMSGFQTRGNLFDASIAVEALRPLLVAAIEAYFDRIRSHGSRFALGWPADGHLNGWCVKLTRSGWQAPHIHPGGWLSGVLYLQMPKHSKADEGAIEFSLRAFDYPILREPIPTRTYRPQAGDLILFPSCLFHRTIPFSSNEERICVAFDLVPSRQNELYGRLRSQGA